jgi:transposase
VSDDEWAFAAPYLTLMTEDAPQREQSWREVFNGLRWIIRAGAAWRVMSNDLPPWASGYQQTQQLILDPARLAAGYADYSAELSRQNAPLLKRCALIDGLLSEQRSQLERLLDLYLAGTFDRQHLTDRKVRLEKTIESLEVERNALMRQDSSHPSHRSRSCS